MRKLLGIVSVIVTILLALLLFRCPTSVNRIEDLNASGAGVELGEWQTGVGIYLTAMVLFGILGAWLLRLRFSTGLTILSWLTFGVVADVVWALHSMKSRIGVINEYGHGLTYGDWQSSVIPWTVALLLVGLCAVSSLVHWRLERGSRSRKGVSPDVSPNDQLASPPGNSAGLGEGRQR